MNKENLKEYQEVFEKYQHSDLRNLIKRGLLFQYDDGLKNPDILFIGINPSFDKKIPFISNSYNKEQVKKILYFKAFHKFERELELKYRRQIAWTHLDLCVFRETTQANINNDILKSDVGANFIMEQLLISKKLMHQINPRLIIVSNTMARRFLGKDAHKGKDVWLGYQFKFDNQLGTYRIKTEGSLYDVPIFFSSMLSGQRILDLGSQERLVWHVNEVLEKIK